VFCQRDVLYFSAAFWTVIHHFSFSFYGFKVIIPWGILVFA
jgi:hypothetical protein